MPIRLTIDGMEIEAEPGTTILEAALAHDIDIPRLCYHPALRPAGSCRLCVVEIEGSKAVQTACTMPVAEGQSVVTESDRLRRLRREALALILAEHPYTCLMCEQGCGDYQVTVRKALVTTGCQYCPANGQCEIQRLVERIGLTEMPYPIHYRGLPIEREDPFFDRDYNLCVLCGRCVRVCQEERYGGVLGFLDRGVRMLVGTAGHRPHAEVECDFCGACVDVCPTGALFDKRSKWEGVADRSVPSVCPYCAVGCALEVQTKKERLIRATARNGEANRGQICVRGRFAIPDVVHHRDRLHVPLVRRDGRLVEASWDEAIAFVARGLAPHRGPAFAALGSASTTNEDAYALQRFTRCAMASPYIALADSDFGASPATIWLAKELVGSERAATIGDLRRADCVVAWGADPVDSHPIVGVAIRVACARGTPLVVIDPRQSATAHGAEVWLPIQPDQDAWLAADLMRRLGLGDDAPLADEALHTAWSEPVPERSMRRAVELLSAAQAPVFVLGSGLWRVRDGSPALRAIAALLDRLPSARALVLAGRANAIGALDMGVHPALLPGYVAVDDERVRQRFGELWGADVPLPPTSVPEEMMAAVANGGVRALLAVGTWPQEMPSGEDRFLVSIDLVGQDRAMAEAHAILPATAFAELEGSFTNLEGRVQSWRPGIPPPGEARPVWHILRDLARQIGSQIGLPVGNWEMETVASVRAEATRLVGAYRQASQGEEWPDGAVRRFAVGAPWPAETAERPSRRAPVDADHPIALIVCTNLDSYFGLSLVREVEGMEKVKTQDTIFVHPEDARRFGLRSGDVARVRTVTSEAQYPIACTTAVPEGIAFVQFDPVASSPLLVGQHTSNTILGVRFEPLGTEGG